MSFPPNEAMRKAAQTAINWNLKQPASGKWGTTVGRRRANQISRGENLSMDVISRMYSFLSRHQDTYSAQRDTGKRGKGYYAYLGWGGPSALAWAKDKLNR